jgi:hypothetical protein
MDDPYAEVKAHFDAVDAVTVNAGKGAQGMKLGTKMFTMFYKGDLVVQLAPERVTELVESGEAQAFDPGTGKPMKDRVLVPAQAKDRWIEFAEESQAYMESRTG